MILIYKIEKSFCNLSDFIARAINYHWYIIYISIFYLHRNLTLYKQYWENCWVKFDAYIRSKFFLTLRVFWQNFYIISKNNWSLFQKSLFSFFPFLFVYFLSKCLMSLYSPSTKWYSPFPSYQLYCQGDHSVIQFPQKVQ